MRVGSLFSGIGGLDLGLERAGFEVVWQVEIDPYCQRVLAKHWPTVRRYEDVRRVHAYRPNGVLRVPAGRGCDQCLEPVDLICGGFPCQPVSLAGKRRGQDDARWLWPEFARIVREVRPRYVLVENVPGLLVRGMGDVLGDLAACGYDAEWDCIPASAVGAPHRRDRVWIVAYPAGGASRPDSATVSGDGERQLAFTPSGRGPRGSRGRSGSANVAYPDGRRHVRDDRDESTQGRELRDAPRGDARADGEPRRGSARGSGSSGSARRGILDRGVAAATVANPERVGGELRRGSGDVGGTAGTREGEAPERERVRDAADDRRPVLADSDSVPNRQLHPGRSDRSSTPLPARQGQLVADADGGRRPQRHAEERRHLFPHSRGDEFRSGYWEVEPDVGRVVDGFPPGLARRQLSALGNAVVPQVAEYIGRRILEAEAAVNA